MVIRVRDTGLIGEPPAQCAGTLLVILPGAGVVAPEPPGRVPAPDA